ncbi:TPA: hypothetical protein OV546_003451 [Acinetobacter baumannii]|nr:hypothetical protein [Acinetobacter baumannii]MDC5511458.1 hypothetical protein [Acinetobacter baumannii]HCV3152277.1 hypothetical protein [Acinetobacter baumannii]
MTQDIEKKFKETSVELAEKIAETLGPPKKDENDSKNSSNKKESILYKLKKEIEKK